MRVAAILKKILRLYLWTSASFLLLFVFWALTGLPLFIDRECILSQEPADAEYIVCVGAGFTTGNLPTDDGWGRIYSAVQLYLDGFGRKIIFTGGGSSRISEAEVYAEAAHWLGLGENDALLDWAPIKLRNTLGIFSFSRTPQSTKEHPSTSATSELHSKRTALCFKKAGFKNFRLVTGYSATGKRIVEEKVVSRPSAEPFLRAERTSQLSGFKQSDKVYNDVFFRLKWRSSHFFTTLRELSALLIYKLKGYI